MYTAIHTGDYHQELLEEAGEFLSLLHREFGIPSIFLAQFTDIQTEVERTGTCFPSQVYRTPLWFCAMRLYMDLRLHYSQSILRPDYVTVVPLLVINWLLHLLVDWHQLLRRGCSSTIKVPIYQLPSILLFYLLSCSFQCSP